MDTSQAHIRIGIDVGGTFTHAVAIDASTYEVAASVQVPTTHTAKEGVALGVVQSLQKILETLKLEPSQVRFVAHATTQATNALLEGDVVQVGIAAVGEGFEGRLVRSNARVRDIEIAPSKYLHTFFRYGALENAPAAVKQLREAGAQVVVAAAAFSVEDPFEEEEIERAAGEIGIASTSTHEMTKLLGLRRRTRTAVINASILPKMMQTADMTEGAVKEAGIGSPLMIMRCDGGVISAEQMRRRPILTLLSGPAAGVAGALMYARISNGIFLEVGGTSTDISAIKNGRVITDYAVVGGHKTYVPALDVRTVGIAGGSMIRYAGGRIVDVGPRSAHIAGLPYASFAAPEDLASASLETFSPREDDPADYALIRAGERRFALTNTCAANVLGLLHEREWAKGQAESARLAFEPLAKALGVTVEAAAERVLDISVDKVRPVVEALIRRNHLDKQDVVLVAGGGAGPVIVRHLASRMHLEHEVAPHAEVISSIGVALALIREVVERTVTPPVSEQLVLQIRSEAQSAAIAAGAAPDSVTVHVEIDSTRNIARAVATGSAEIKQGERAGSRLSEEALLGAAAQRLGVANPRLAVSAGSMRVFTGELEAPLLFGLLRRKRNPAAVIDHRGVAALRLSDAAVMESTASTVRGGLEMLLNRLSTYDAGGEILPDAYVVCEGRLIDVSGLQTVSQAAAFIEAELKGAPPGAPAAVLAQRRK